MSLKNIKFKVEQLTRTCLEENNNFNNFNAQEKEWMNEDENEFRGNLNKY